MKVCTDACILGALAGSADPQRILDIGAGTGLLSLMLSQRYSCPVDAVEPHPGAYGDARLNFSRSPWAGRLSLYNQRIQEFRPKYRYDLIVSNPPFFSNHKRSAAPGRNAALHNDDLPFSDLVKAVIRLLDESGRFFVLLPPHEWTRLDKMLELAGFFPETRRRIRNFPEKDPFRIVASYAFRPVKSADSELIIQNDPAGYTDQFRSLLQPFYLNF